MTDGSNGLTAEHGALAAGGSTARATTRGLGRRFGHAANTYIGVGGVLVVLCAYLTITEDKFLTWTNFVNILDSQAKVLVVAVGLTFVLLVGGIDLSLGGMIALIGVGMAEMLNGGVNPWLAIAAGVLAGAALGTVNGVLIGKIGLSFLVVTLGTGSILRSIALVRTDGQSQSLFEVPLLADLQTGEIAGLPYLVWFALIVLVVGIIVLRYTGLGRMIYATGGNREAARFAGINVTAVSITVFGIAGVLAGVAAVMNIAQLRTASPTAVTGIELTAAAAVLLGGTSFMGGRGTLLGTLLGVLFLGVLQNGITLADISSFWEGIVSGAVLIAAVLLDRIRNGTAAT
jgi:ribose/xylose/arabinose/galactoside ABC-type transport system permease subunit